MRSRAWGGRAAGWEREGQGRLIRPGRINLSSSFIDMDALGVGCGDEDIQLHRSGLLIAYLPSWILSARGRGERPSIGSTKPSTPSAILGLTSISHIIAMDILAEEDRAHPTLAASTDQLWPVLVR